MWLAVVPGLLVVSCEKIREIKNKVGGGAEEVANDGSGVMPGGDALPELQALVDLNEQGYLFRRDQAFPEHLTVRQQTSVEISKGRLFGRSALGNQTEAIEGTWEDTVNIERNGSKVTIKIETTRFVKPIIEGENGQPAVPAVGDGEPHQSLAGVGATFLKLDKGWQLVGEQSDFRVMAWAQQIRDRLDDYLPGTGVIPNSPWFGPKRILPGVKVELRGPETALILGAGASGHLQLTFDRVENIGGHPCGVFQWSGEFTVANQVNLAGENENLEMSVSKGQIWCSLIHPLLLRTESEGVMTIERRTPGGGLTTRIQGSVKKRQSRTWTPAGN
jgi:hypothetical protein